ncbi:zinc finger CCCH domain-containing protein 69 [Dorcoceras hygrometricum]|uniref:Zinc finger CCCH domain-containing protein 69 n=1 Tax=Dorcoceras hygrometricum TaxID=472368 RepID=A0A2Z7AI55_9LAMI|nr:zinc finger CCCH domain-containing protein 69 [Dorcoceras hygrometricum]
MFSPFNFFRVQCKFFAHGACLKGEHCEFSHDWKAAPNNICTFYQKGMCAYGSRCRYEHVKPSRSHSPVPSSAAELSFSVVQPSGTAGYDACSSPALITERSAANGSSHTPSRLAWGEKVGHQDLPESAVEARSMKSVDPSDQSICSFAAAGACPRGNKCPHIHGDTCPTCAKQCLHPYRPQEREEHMKTCEKMQKHLEALRHSQEIECSVCLERVLSKPVAAERKFGILSECDHPFCISCIRNWRGSSPASGLDINAALRACPICRKLSYFVIPSVIWYSSKEEKLEIVDSYKKKLKSIDCKHFDFGNGTCPFGTSCFYKHAYRDGTLEEVVLRHLGDEDGNTVIVKEIRFHLSN